MRSVNLWEKGRRTDDYRGKNRILGENLSLLHQHIATNNSVEPAGATMGQNKARLVSKNGLASCRVSRSHGMPRANTTARC